MRGRMERSPVRVTEEWFQTYCAPRITDRDKNILRFLYDHRIAIPSQLSKVFWGHCKDPVAMCIDRLRVLYDLHCIDRFYPPVSSGTSPQHIVLDRAGAKVLGLPDGWKRTSHLPATFRHTVFVTDFCIMSHEAGFGWGEREVRLGPVVADVWFPGLKMAVEIDTGTETHTRLRKKAGGYSRIREVETLVFITTGPIKRARTFLSSVRSGAGRIGVTWDKVEGLFNTLNREVGTTKVV